MMKFKNLRRPNKSITFDKENEPPPKRRRWNERLWYSPSPEDDADMMYDDAVSNLQKEWAKTKPKEKNMLGGSSMLQWNNVKIGYGMIAHQ